MPPFPSRTRASIPRTTRALRHRTTISARPPGLVCIAHLNSQSRDLPAQRFFGLFFVRQLSSASVTLILGCFAIRLYQPPVESDLPAKPAVERDAARARTSIRRNFRRTADEVRERRRRIQAAAAAHRVFNDPRRSASGSTFEPPALSPRTNDHGGATSASDQGRRALRDVASRMGTLDDRVAALFGDRWAHLHADSHSSSLRDDDSDSSPMLTMAVDPEFLPRSRPPLEPYTLSNIRSTQAANHAVSAFPLDTWFLARF